MLVPIIGEGLKLRIEDQIGKGPELEVLTILGDTELDLRASLDLVSARLNLEFLRANLPSADFENEDACVFGNRRRRWQPGGEKRGPAQEKEQDSGQGREWGAKQFSLRKESKDFQVQDALDDSFGSAAIRGDAKLGQAVVGRALGKELREALWIAE